MTSRTLCLSVIAFILCISLPARGQQYLLYTPQPATSGQAQSSREGILVKEITIQKGDTLSALSRKYSGRGKYYPQILLFNSIKNPNLIYTGKILRVPVSQKDVKVDVTSDAGPVDTTPSMGSGDGKSAAKANEASVESSSISAPQSGLSAPEIQAGTAKSNTRPNRKKRKSAVTTLKKSPQESPATAQQSPSQLPEAQSTTTTADSASGQKLFEAAVKAYRTDDCRSAIELLDRYLADNSGSSLAADATLYKAECYMRLSAQ